MKKYNITDGKFDIDRLHDIFLNGLDNTQDLSWAERRRGYSTLFAFQLIGLAQLDIYSYKESDNRIIWIAANKPLHCIQEIRAVIRYVCEREGVRFVEIEPRKSIFRFAINNTIFDFFRINDDSDIAKISGQLIIPPCVDNDCCY